MVKTYEYRGQSIFPILKVKPVSFKQLHQKYPVFEICLQKTFDVQRLKVNTKKLEDDTFEILDGYNELTGGRIIERCYP
jgi:hypothetical protein